MTTDDDIAEIRRIRQQVEDAENALDSAALASLFTDDIAMLPVGQEPIHGADRVEAHHRDLYDGMDDLEVRFSIDDVRVLGGLAVEHGTYTWSIPDLSGETLAGDGLYLYTYERTADDQWRISRMSWS